jgi:hypothetical protein
MTAKTRISPYFAQARSEIQRKSCDVSQRIKAVSEAICQKRTYVTRKRRRHASNHFYGNSHAGRIAASVHAIQQKLRFALLMPASMVFGSNQGLAILFGVRERLRKGAAAQTGKS